MRINKALAAATDLSRRAADQAIAAGRVTVNGARAATGYDVLPTDTLALDGIPVTAPKTTAGTTIMFNKPAGFVVSRNGQGSRTIYELLPEQYQRLQPIGRLDKDSTGLLLLTNDGQLAERLTHPRHQKTKVYNVTLNRPLDEPSRKVISGAGVVLEDGTSKLELTMQNDPKHWQVTMHEGRKRQIRRTFRRVGYTVTRLHRIQFGDYQLGDLGPGDIRQVA